MLKPGNKANPTYDPVFTKMLKSTSANMHPGLCADHNMTAGNGTHMQSVEGPMYYAQPQLTTSSAVQCPTSAENDQVNGFQNSQVQQYALLSDMPASILTPDDHQKTEYAVVTQQPSKPTSDEGVDPNEKKMYEEITDDQAFHTLLQYSSQWQSLGEALSLDEDHLDEIFTNNETDEACLQEMLRLYFKRSDLEHSWEVINAALKRIGNKSCTTENDMHHRPQTGLLEKAGKKLLKQMETSGGGPVLQPLLINKNAEGSTSIAPHRDKPPDKLTCSTFPSDSNKAVNSNLPSSYSVGEANQSDDEQNSQGPSQDPPQDPPQVPGTDQYSNPTTTDDPEQSPGGSEVEASVAADIKLKQTVEGVNGEELHVVSNDDLASRIPFIQPKELNESNQESTSASHEKVPGKRTPVSLPHRCDIYSDPTVYGLEVKEGQGGAVHQHEFGSELREVNDTSGSEEENFDTSTCDDAIEDKGTEELTGSPPNDGLLQSKRSHFIHAVKHFTDLEAVKQSSAVISKESGGLHDTEQLATPEEIHTMRKPSSDSVDEQLPVIPVATVSEETGDGQEHAAKKRPKDELALLKTVLN